jgi:hypothetical protein
MAFIVLAQRLEAQGLGAQGVFGGIVIKASARLSPLAAIDSW